MNTRPIPKLSNDSNDIEALGLGYFLIKRPLMYKDMFNMKITVYSMKSDFGRKTDYLSEIIQDMYQI